MLPTRHGSWRGFKRVLCHQTIALILTGVGVLAVPSACIAKSAHRSDDGKTMGDHADLVLGERHFSDLGLIALARVCAQITDTVLLRAILNVAVFGETTLQSVSINGADLNWESSAGARLRSKQTSRVIMDKPNCV